MTVLQIKVIVVFALSQIVFKLMEPKGDRRFKVHLIR
jgi:hypothetical protein